MGRSVAVGLGSIGIASVITGVVERQGWIRHATNEVLEDVLACILLGILAYAFVLVPARARWSQRDQSLRLALESERSLRAEFDRLFMESPVGMALLAANGRVISANEVLARIVGRPVEALRGPCIDDLLPGVGVAGLLERGGSEPWISRVERDVAVEERELHLALDTFSLSPAAGGVDGAAALVMVKDETDGKKHQAALARTEQEMRAIVEDQTEMVCRFDASRRITFANRAFRAFFGLAAGELPAGPFLPEPLPEERGFVDRKRGAISPEKPIAQYWYKASGPDGVLKSLDWTERGLFDPDGKRLGSLAVGRDLTELSDAHRLARANEERFRATFDQAAIGMCEAGLDGRFRRVNRRLCEILGYPAEELLERTFQDVTHPDDAVAEPQEVARALRGEAGDFSVEKRYVRKDGSGVWVDVAVSLLKGATGEPEAIIGAIEDLTARRLAEEAVRQERQHLRFILDEAPVLVWLSSPDGQCTFFNKTWLEFTGRTAEEERGDGWAAGVHPDDLPGCLATYQAALAAIEPFRMEYRLRRHDGVYRWIYDRGVPLKGPDGAPQGFLGSCVDITPMREAAERVSASREKLRALSTRIVNVQEEERRLLSRELHDGLGQTLTGLTYGLRWVAQRVEDPTGELDSRLKGMVREVESAILEVRDLSRRLRPAALDLGLVAALETEAAAFRRRTGLGCDLVVPPERLDLDPGRALALFRITQEALTNVIRHAAATRVEVRVRQEGCRVRLEVADDGRGFDEAALSSPDALGLTGLRERVAPFAGSLTVRCNKPRGTRVVADIPTAPPSKSPPRRPV